MADLPTVDSLLGEPPAPSVDEVLGPAQADPGFGQRMRYASIRAKDATDRILGAFGTGASAVVGERWGLDPSTQSELVQAGILNKNGQYDPLKSFNDIILRPLAWVFDTGMAAIGGAGAALNQASIEAGITEPSRGDAAAAGRYFAGLPLFVPEVGGPRVPGARAQSAALIERAQEAGVLQKKAPIPADMNAEAYPLADGRVVEAPTNISVGSKAKDTAGNINLDQLNLPDEVKDVVRATADARVIAFGDSSPFIDQRRGVRTKEMTKKVAAQLGLTEEQMTKGRKGQAYNAEELEAQAQLLERSAIRVQELAREARYGSDAQMAAFEEAWQRHAMIQETFAGSAAEAGRALNALNRVRKVTGSAEEIRKLIQESGGVDKIQELAAAVSSINDLDAVGKFAREARKPTTMDKIRELWINGLLSATTTHQANMIGNALVMAARIPEHYTAATLGLFRGGERISFREAHALTFGLIQGSRDVLWSLWKSAKNMELDTGRGSEFGRALLKGEASDAATKLDLAHNRAIGGSVGEIIRTPGRLLVAEDELFKSINYRMSVNALSVREARKMGLEGKEFRDKVAELRNNPTEKMLEKAEEEKAYFTLQSPLGEAAQHLMRMRAANKATRTVGGFVVPFIRIAVNVNKYALGERTPLGALAAFGDGKLGKSLRGELGKPAQDMAIARIALATTVGIGITSLAAEGFVTGAAPTDPKERAQFYAEGKLPYAVLIGDKYHTYDRYGPHGLLMGVWADLVNMGDALEEGEADKIWATTMASVTNNLVNKTWLSGPSQLMAAVQEPERYGDRYVQQFLGSFVPGIVSQSAREVDPVMRDVRSVTDSWLSRVPFASREVYGRRDVFGELMKREGSAFVVGNVSTVRQDPVVGALKDVGIWPAQLDRQIKGVDLTAKQYDEYQQIAGRLMHNMIWSAVTQPGWSQLSGFTRQKTLSGMIDSAREQARTTMMMRWPQILNDAVNLKTGGYAP